MSERERPKVVFDCMIYFQATARPNGPAAACLMLLDAGLIELAVSEDILREVHHVLTRPKVQRKNPLLSEAVAANLIARLRRTATLVDPVPALFSYRRDPDDVPYLNLAIATGAALLVTRDNDLLDLMADSPDGIAFRGLCPGIAILQPSEFLRMFPVLDES